MPGESSKIIVDMEFHGEVTEKNAEKNNQRHKKFVEAFKSMIFKLIKQFPK